MPSVAAATAANRSVVMAFSFCGRSCRGNAAGEPLFQPAGRFYLVVIVAYLGPEKGDREATSGRRLCPPTRNRATCNSGQAASARSDADWWRQRLRELPKD